MDNIQCSDRIAKGKLRGQKCEYKDGVGCCIWYPLGNDEDVGVCFDFNYEDIDDLIALLKELKEVPIDKL